jgi:hypothetical protein
MYVFSRLFILVCTALFLQPAFAQGVKISATGGDPDPASLLELESTQRGFLPPRMTTAERNTIPAPVPEGLTIFNTDTKCTNVYTGQAWRQLCGECDFTVAVLSNSPLCEGESLSLSATQIPGAAYYWTGPGGFTSDQTAPVIPSATASQSGMYTLVTTLDGCTSAPQFLFVTVFPNPAAPVIQSNSPVCEGDALELSAAQVQGASYAWSGPDNFTSALSAVTIDPVSAIHAGEYELTVTVNGCSASQTTAVSTVPLPSAANAGQDETLLPFASTLVDTDCSAPTPDLILGGSPVATYADGIIRLTPAQNGPKGWVTTSASHSGLTNQMEVEFDFFIGGGNGADGIMIAFGPEADINGWVIGNTNGGNISYSNNILQFRLMTYWNQRTMFWGGSQLASVGGGPARNVWYPMRITISATGLCNVTVNNQPLFSNIQLPPSYMNLGKGGWKWCILGYTGGLNDRHEIDNLSITETIVPVSTTLQAEPPAEGSGMWSVLSGTGFSFSDPADPGALFTGQSGQTYTLQWTVTNSCGTETDTVVIAF